MRAIRMLTAVVVVSALGALSVATASAHEWRVGGISVTGPTGAGSEGTLLFENIPEHWSSECEVRRQVTLLPGGLGEVTSIKTKTGAKLMKCPTKTSGGCETEAEIEAVNLPWRTELATISGELRDKIVKIGGEPEWKITCRYFGFKTIDWCKASTNTAVHNSVNLVEEIYDAKSPGGLCQNDGASPAFFVKGMELVYSPSGGVAAS